MKSLTLIYVNAAQIGYGRLGVELEHQLTARGYTVYNGDGNPSPTPQTKEGGVTGGRRAAPTPTNLNCLISVPSHQLGYWDHQYRSIITMWEAMELPEAFRENFHEFEQIIVPSRQNVELFSRYHDNVVYMPLGVDPDLWHYVAPSPPERDFRFLISGRGTRKGVDLVYRAFREVFAGVPAGDGPVPRLIMKSRSGHQEYYGDGIEQITGTLDPLAERDLYASAHCYVQPSRGEGFGLQPLQAIALGRPTILTDAHGHESYAHLGIGLGWDHIHSDEFLFGEAGDWWEPRYDELCEQMWDVYKNWASHAETAKKNAVTVADEWTWSHTTDRFLELTGEQATLPYMGSGRWIASTRQLFSTILHRDYSCDIAGRMLHFTKGREYWETADVKRILFDGGLLDNACLTTDDHGLAPQQVAQLGGYRAQHEPCPTCHRLPDGESVVDRIEREMIAAGD